MNALRVLSATWCGVGLAASLGCVMPDHLSQVQKDVADVQQQMQRIEQTQSDIETLLAERPAEVRVDPLDTVAPADLAELRLEIEQFSRQISISDQRMREIDQRLDGYSQDLQLARSGALTSSVLPPAGTDPLGTDLQDPSINRPPPSAAIPDPEALYNTAYADFSKGNYELAISGFREYQELFPDSALADNALYWIAECDYSQGNYRGAVDALDTLLQRYPDSDKSPAANLKKAMAFQEQNQIGQAIIQFRYVVSAFPDTDESRLARDKLAGLGASAN